MNGPESLRIVLVTGLSGAGKNSILRALEDLGFETMDNPPLHALEELVARSERNLAIGVDVRSRGFNAAAILESCQRLQQRPQLRLALVFATADDETLLRRYTETRRRHPLAQAGSVADGIEAERALTAQLRAAADWVVDTSALPLPELRRDIERRFGAQDPGMVVSLVSFAFSAGLPREADMVFDARFLRNPHYDAMLQKLTGLDAEVGAFIEQDPDFLLFYDHVLGMVEFVLPRFVQEGKQYATIAIGCTGGRHRSVYIVELLAADLAKTGWRVRISHREQIKREQMIMKADGER